MDKELMMLEILREQNAATKESIEFLCKLRNQLYTLQRKLEDMICPNCQKLLEKDTNADGDEYCIYCGEVFEGATIDEAQPEPPK